MFESNPLYSQKCKKQGFALVLALALLSLVFLLVISLVNLVSTDLSLVEARKEKILAQVHARMGMKVAIGEIQKHLGPDMRISGTADLLDERIESGRNFLDQAYEEDQISQTGVDLNEDGKIDALPFGQRYWTGVWKQRGRDRGVDQNKLGAKPLPENLDTGDKYPEEKNSDPMTSSEFDPHPAIEIAWLVSGNEGFSHKMYFGNGPNQLAEFVEIPDGNIWDPDQPDNGRGFIKGGVYGSAENPWEDYANSLLNSSSSPVLRGLNNNLPGYNHPLYDLPDPETSEDVEWILKAPLMKEGYDPKNPEKWEDFLGAEPVKVRKTRIQNNQKENQESKYGAYAYWVGDEGVKANMTIFNPNKKSADLDQKKDNLSVATEPNLAFAYEGSGSSNDLKSGFGLEWDAEFSDAKRSNIFSLGMLANEVAESTSIKPHYHSLTTDSFGVLSDVRTGGLKRDLSSAFANEDDWGNLADISDAWADDFSNYIYKQRIYYQKSVPLQINAILNDWRTSSSDQLMLEEHALLAGPRWSTLGAFHNLYLASNYGDIHPTDFPRIVGDNNVLFNHLLPFGVKPNSPGNSPSITKSSELRKYFNYFKGLETRPEPKNHPIHPVLVEVKYSQHPIFEESQLGLAIYPSVAFWNPYDVPISSKDLFIEIPLTVRLEALNAKHFDYYRKWFMSIVDIDLFEQENPNVDPNRPRPPIPKVPTFDDKNGNGIQDPGERSFPPSNTRPGGNGGPVLVPPQLENFYSFFGSPPFDIPVEFADGLPKYGDFVGDKLGKKINVTFLLSSNSDNLSTYGNRHLLLRIPNFQLEAGEKAHFTVGTKQTIQNSPLPASGETKFLEVELTKLISGVEDTPALLLSGSSITPFSDPIAIHDTFGDINGVHPNSTETFNSTGLKSQSSMLEQPKGITIYSETPKNVSYDNRKIIGKINKHFYLSSPAQNYYYENSDVLEIPNNQNLPGYGFILRFKFPAKSESVVFEQFNIRALVNSNQDGYGDNWDIMHFNSHESFPTPKLHNYQGQSVFFFGGKNRTVEKYPNFYDLDLSPLSPTPVYVDPDLGVMPRVKAFDSYVGFFHDYDDLSPMKAEKNAIMFEVPKSPLLSILQFRHANLNNYSHGPSYAFGNSYASTQVPRYQTWGKMKAFDEVPVFGSMNVMENIEIAKTWMKDGATYNVFPWSNKEISYDDPIRDTYVGKDHQNVTLDHSFYLNYALLDGYFMSGLGIGSKWDEEEPNSFEPGNRYLPYRNPRLIPFLRYSERQITSYADKNKGIAASGSDSDYRFQTLAGDLLVHGQFNVNSTSVDAWASHISALRGQAIQGTVVGPEETPVPRFLEYKSTTSNSWNTLRKLSDQEINILANKIVEQVKLRGPFLSYSDFANRRLQGMKINLFIFPLEKWANQKETETIASSLGLRGAIQAAVAESSLNHGGLSNKSTDSFAPIIPSERFLGNNPASSSPPLVSEMNFVPFAFGTHAVSQEKFSYPGIEQKWGKGVSLDKQVPIKLYSQSAGKTLEVKRVYLNYSDTFSYGEAPENLLAVENVATGANKPGWIMQSDILSPLAPVTSVRSDTFVIRVMGETMDGARSRDVSSERDSPTTTSKAWIELTVQRVPDYVKSDLDNPHHRPHEPFEDRNFNGYWDPEIKEHWIDLNQDSVTRTRDGTTQQKTDAYPNLAGDNPTFADGLESDLPLTKDPDEEDATNNSVTVSRMGINQRFGRKFKIIKFRWLKAQDV